MRIANRVSRLVIGVGLTLSCAAAAQQSSPERVLIDGAKNPEMIPEYLTWSSALDTIALLKENNAVDHGPLKTLLSSIAPPDAELVFAEAAGHKQRSAACDERGKGIVATMKGEDVKKLEKAMKANTLACREALLDSKDRLLARLSPEGATAVTTWVLSERSKIKALVVKTDLEFFRQPR